MRELIQGLVQTESEAKAMVQAARQEGERLLADGQKRAQSVLARVRAETRVQAEKIIDSSVQQARAAKKQALEKAEVELGETVRLDSSIQDQLVEAVVQVVCGVPLTPQENEKSAGEAPSK